MKTVNRSGIKYGRLTALRVDESIKKVKGKCFNWICLCDCGNVVSVNGSQLGHRTNSCGCLKIEASISNLPNSTHGKSKDRLWRIWYGMKDRCYNEKCANYNNYGGSGIFLCNDWKKDFYSFEKWALVNGYEDNLSIDRIDNYKGYNPENCRFITMDLQAGNKKTTLRVEYKGEIMSLSRAYNISNPKISYHGAKKRYHKGERDPEKLFALPRQHRGN